MNIFEQSINELTTYFLRRDAWETWTPTVDQGGAVAGTILYARYTVLAQTVILTCAIDLTAGGVGGNAIIIAGIPTAIQPV
ncbi:MAG: hypothetical protein ACXABY_29490, partial [Candidatus Thorarchaeota archaeon]